MNDETKSVEITRNNHLYYFYDAKHDTGALMYIPVDTDYLIDVLYDIDQIFHQYYSTAVPIPTWKTVLNHFVNAVDFTNLLEATTYSLLADARQFSSQPQPIIMKNPDNEDPSDDQHSVLAVIVETRHLVNFQPNPEVAHVKLNDDSREWFKKLITGKIKIDQKQNQTQK